VTTIFPADSAISKLVSFITRYLIGIIRGGQGFSRKNYSQVIHPLEIHFLRTSFR